MIRMENALATASLNYYGACMEKYEDTYKEVTL